MRYIDRHIYPGINEPVMDGYLYTTGIKHSKYLVYLSTGNSNVRV